MSDLALSIRITGDAKGLKAEVVGAEGDLKGLASAAGRTGSSLDGMAKDADRAAHGTRQAAADSRDFAQALRVLPTLIAAIGLGKLATDLVSTNAQFQSLSASLKTSLGGSAEAARAAMAEIEKFAANTPYQLDQAVRAFIKLKNMGLDPSMEALRSYGNTAASMSKGLMDMIEAVADAATGEFERLKEFGIRASSEGNKVAFTFQGVTTVVGKNAKEIETYLRRIGEVQFAGAMAEQMNILGGAWSNLQDTLDKFYRTVGEGGLNDALMETVRAFEANIGSSQDFARALGADLGEAVRGTASALQFLVEHADAAKVALGGLIGMQVASWLHGIAGAVATLTASMLANPLFAAAAAIAAGIGLVSAALVVYREDLQRLIGGHREASQAVLDHQARMRELAGLTSESTGLSREAAQAKLQEAIAVREATKAKFQEAQAEIERKRAALLSSRGSPTGEAAQGLLEAQRQRGAIGAEIQQLDQAIAALQQRLVSLGTTAAGRSGAGGGAGGGAGVDKLREALERLKGQLDPVHAATAEYQTSIKTLDDALAAHLLTQKQHQALLVVLGKAHQDELDGIRSKSDVLGRHVDEVERANAELRLTLNGQEDLIPLLRAEADLRDELGRELLPEERARLREVYDEQQRLNQSIRDRRKAEDEAKQAAQESARAWERMVDQAADYGAERIADQFFSRTRQGWKELLGGMAEDFVRALIHMAAQAALRPVIVTVGQALGLAPAGAGGGMAGLPGQTYGSSPNDFIKYGSLLQSGGGSSMLYGVGEWIATSQVGQTLGMSASGAAGGFFGGSVGGLPSYAVPSYEAAAALGPGMAGSAPATMTGAGSAFAQGLSYSPWGILGGLGAKLLGFNGSGNMLLDFGLQTAGAVGGAALGAAAGAGGTIAGLQAGSVLGPIGAIAGAFLGTMLGGLVADEDIPWAASVKQVRGGQARTTYQDSLDGADASKLSGALDQFMQAASGLAQLTGTALADYQVRLVSGRGQDMFDVRTLQDEEMYRAWTLTPSSATKALRAMIIGGSYEGLNADAVRAAKLYTGTDAEALGSRVAFGQQFRAATATMMGRDQDPVVVLRQQVEAKVAEIDGFLTQTAEAFGATSWQMDRASMAVREMVESMAGLNPAAAALSGGEAAVKAVNDNFAAWTPLFQQVGISAKRAAAAHKQALDDLRAGWTATIQDAITAITDPAALAVRQWEQARAAALRDAKAVGADAGAVKRLYDLQWGQLSGRDAADAALRERALARLGDAARLRDLAGAQWGGRMAAMLSGAEAGADPWKAYSAAMDELRRQLGAGTVSVMRYQELVGLLTDTYDRAAEAAAAARQEEQALAAARKAQAADLKAWLSGQLLGATSTLSPQERLDEARQQFAGLLGQARRDGGADTGALAAAADRLLEIAAPLMGSTTAYATLVDWTRGQMKSLGKALKLPGFAEGGLHIGGARLVGERGPEIEVTGPARYWSFEQTRTMLGGAGGGDGAVAAAVERLAGRVERLGQRLERAEAAGAGAVVAEVAALRDELRRQGGEIRRLADVVVAA